MNYIKIIEINLPNFYGLEEEELEFKQVFTDFKALGLSFMLCFKLLAEVDSQVAGCHRM